VLSAEVQLVTRAKQLEEVADEALGCERCELHLLGTQTVFGEGDVPAEVMFVGEQPGDKEDTAGHPFVGPAGGVLHRGIERSGLAERRHYLTNAVKHFRWEERGKRRIHKTPGVEHVRACHVWLEQELRLVRPKVLVLLGATAAKSLAPDLKVTRDRGRPLEVAGVPTVLTTHPSAVLRSRERDAAMDAFVADLDVAARLLDEVG
jgi:uracil-DNA glycosylase family protein